MRYVPIYLQQGLIVLSLTSGTSSCFAYHCSSHLGEVDEDELSTLRHTFFDLLHLVRVVVGSSG
jgi:hypothetical protein